MRKGALALFPTFKAAWCTATAGRLCGVFASFSSRRRRGLGLGRAGAWGLEEGRRVALATVVIPQDR